MSDIFRARLTGVIRDYAAPVVGADLDPYCEVEAEVLDQSFDDAATTIAIRVTTPAGIPVPWYAAALYLFNTLNFTTSGAGATGDRVYTLNNGTDDQPVVLSLRAERDFSGLKSVCVEIPYTFTFDAVVLGIALPTDGGFTDVDDAIDDDTKGPGVVFPGNFARLMIVAPDGTSYGATKDGTDNRFPFGYYPFIGAGATPVDGGDLLTELRANYGAQGLQPWTPVKCSTLIPEDAAGEIFNSDYLHAWQIRPCDRPDAYIIEVFDGSNATTVNFRPGRIVVWDEEGSSDKWDLAAVKDTGGGGVNITAKSPLQKLGVVLWQNGESIDPEGRAAVVLWGRFWLNPEVVDLSPHTTYYLNPEADWGGSGATAPGTFTDRQPSNSPIHRPVFRHVEQGWCIMIDSEPSQHLAWAYEGDPQGSDLTPETRLAEMVFDSYPSTEEAEGVLRFRDRDYDDSADLASGEVPNEQAEANDVMAWFVGDSGVHRAFVMKRLDLIFDSGVENVTGDPADGAGGWENDPDRPGVLSWFYRNGTRITDEWATSGGTTFDRNSNHMARLWAKPGTHSDSDPGSERGGIITWSDAGAAVVEWYVHPSLDSGGSPYGLNGDFEQRDRKFAWSIAHEFYGRDCEWFSYDGADWQSSVLIRDADSPWSSNHTLQTASLAGSITAALPLRIRELTICDDTDTERKILVLCSDMYD